MPLPRIVVVVGVLVAFLGLSAEPAGAALRTSAAAPSAPAVPSPTCAPSGSYDQCTVTFTSTGAEQQLTVPSNLVNNTNLVVEAIGAAGLAGNRGSMGNSLQSSGSDCWYPAGGNPTGGGTPGNGGQGADVSGGVLASPGQTLYVEVGGTASFRSVVGPAQGVIASDGGWNGGGQGGPGAHTGGQDCGGYGGGGGGASDVQTCSIGSNACKSAYGTANDPRLIVAAGGAGGGGSGAASNSPGFNGGGAGQGGTGDGTIAVKGGSAGVNASGTGGNGGGLTGLGGTGGGGGGGGGYKGGGGGDGGSFGGAGGGGGGSNRVPASGSQSLSSSAAKVVISYLANPATTLSAVSGSGTYGGPFTLTATLTSRGVPVSGKTITFTWAIFGNPSLCGTCPTTNASGTASFVAPNLGGRGAGTWPISASFAGDSSYSASSGDGNVVITKAGSTTTIACTGTPFTYDGSTHGCTASWASTGNDGLGGALATISYTGRNGTTYNSTTAPTNVGDYTASASFAGDANHNGSNALANFFYIVKASQTVTFSPITTKTLGSAPFGVSPTSTSGLAVTVSSNTSGFCTVSANTVTLVAPGICSLTASQAGNSNYTAATPVTQTFDVVSKTLVKDGGFELPLKLAGSVTTLSAGQKLGPWSVTAGSIDLLNGYWQNGTGAQSIDLAGLAPGTITQTISLPYTATYTLKFKFAGNPEGLPVKKHMLITANAPSWGSPVSASKIFDTTSTTISAMGWKASKLTFPGTAGDVVTLTFQDTDTGTANGMALDAIAMTAG